MPHLSLKLVVCSGDGLPWGDVHFDVVVSHGVLDSMPYAAAERCMKEIHRVLAKDGLFYLDLISGHHSKFSREFTGEEVVAGGHECGTVQSYFNYGKIQRLTRDLFAIDECTLIHREDVKMGGRSGRYHVVLRKL